MKAVIQRVTSASVSIDGNVKSEIGKGLMILLGIGHEDEEEDIKWLAKKIVNLRVFRDEEGAMNQNIFEIDGELMVVSQFTLHAKTKKGNRPSFIHAAKPVMAIPIYEDFVKYLAHIRGKDVASGEFGADMQISLVNDGPVTIVIDTKNKV